MLSVAALTVTVWVMVDFLDEQRIVRELIRRLPADAAPEAENLLSELRWQFRLSTLVVLNSVGTGVAVLMLWRAYWTSQRSLRDVQVLAADVLNSMDQAVVTTDRTGIVTSANRQALHWLGMDEHPVDSRLADWCDVYDLESLRLESTTAHPSRQTRQFVIRDEDGPRTFVASCHSLKDETSEQIGFVLQLRDETTRILMEDQMRRMEQFMGLGSLAAGLHHEIKNPLTALSLHVQLLEENVESGGNTDDTREMLGVIKTEVTRISGVLESFRDYASLDRLDPSPVKLADLLASIGRLVEPQALAARVTIEMDVAPGIPSLKLDRLRIEQVLLNLMLNAIEAMPRGGRISVSAVSHANFVTIEIADGGRGVPQHIRQRIFDPYFTTKSTGTGLGLAFCEKVIRQHQGSLELKTIELDDNVSTGATFVIKLPLGTHS